MLTCQSSEKSNYCTQGKLSILVDDNPKNGRAWEKAGGTFILHRGGRGEGVRGGSLRTVWLLKKVIFPYSYNLREVEAVEGLLKEGRRVREAGGGNERFSLFSSALDGEVVFVDRHSGFFFFSFFILFYSTYLLLFYLGEKLQSQLLGDLQGNQKNEEKDEQQSSSFPQNIFSISITHNPDHITQKKHPKKLSPASLLHLAFRSPCGTVRCYVIDLLNCHNIVRNALARFLQSPSILKVGFGIREEAPRLLSSLLLPLFNDYTSDSPDLSDFVVESLLDLRTSLPMISHISIGDKNNFSLTTAVHQLVGKETDIEGNDEKEESEWEQRPLSKQQLSSAAVDCLSILGLFDILCDEKEEWGKVVREVVGCLEEGVGVGGMRELERYARGEGDKKNQKNILFTGIFFPENEQRKLLQKLPPVHSNIFGDHVTLAYHPSPFHLANLPFGAPCEVTVILNTAQKSSRCQAVRVEIGEGGGRAVGEMCVGGVPHITLSCSPNTSPSFSSEVLSGEGTAGSDSSTLSLWGVVGAAVGREGGVQGEELGEEQGEGDLLGTLPDLVKEKIMDFMTGFYIFIFRSSIFYA